MDRWKGGAVLAVLVIAIGAGGAAVRASVLVTQPQTAIVLAMVVAIIVLTIVFGRRVRGGRGNPYW